METLKKMNPVVAILICAAALIAAVVIGLKTMSPGGFSGEKTANVRPANPDDPKYKPSPRLNLSGGGT